MFLLATHPMEFVLRYNVIIAMIILDGFGLYTFNNERLIIIGACIFVVLIPFFKEITIKDFSFKKEISDE